MLGPAALDALRGAVGAPRVVTDPDQRATHETDWTRRWRGDAGAVVRPATTAEVQAVIQAARRHRFALVPQGGNTGLVGGAVPTGGAVVVDLRGLDDLEPVDVAAAQVTVGAGVALARLQAHVAPHGLEVPVDLAARDTATIGGMVATNAGGTHVIRHGSMRAQLLGLEAVLGNGDVVRSNLAGLLKDNTGYDLAGLLCGSEGTLGIVTRARLRLAVAPAERVVLLVGFASVEDAVAVLPRLRARAGLAAVEMMRGDGVALVAEHLGATFPLQPVPPCTLLVELVGDHTEADLAALVATAGVVDAATAVATDAVGQAALWRWREAHPEAAAAHGVVHKADVTVPVDGLAALSGRVDAVVERVAPGARTIVYGHLADGNLHVNIVGPTTDDERPVDAVLELVLELGGSVSAEHGIGTAKRAWLERQRGASVVAAMRAVKAALDPDGILNPGVLLPDAP
ncbi:MAG: FAD-binding oxidoreductase [Acidimicrobiales bacterium]